jgi:hypothetical protein
MVMGTGIALGACATWDGAAPKTGNASKKKKSEDKSFSLYSEKDLNWKALRRGEKERGGAALDSY